MGRKIQRHELKPGDHIYAWRSVLYTHHGIYVGDEMVIHFTQRAGSSFSSAGSSFSSASSHSSNRCGVIESSLDCFLDGGELYLCEYGVNPIVFAATPGTTSMKQSDPADRVIHRAKSRLQIGFGTYDVITNNCEHFAVYCKTGSGGSGQLLEWVIDVTLPGGLFRRFLRRFI